jgi:hypothetical protein
MTSSTYNEYFKYEGSYVVDNINYEVYQPHGFPLILKATSGRVLATIQVFFDDTPIYNNKYPIPVPFEAGFQIIFQSDDSIDLGRPIKYVITQHCKEATLVKIDLGFNNVPSCVTDPPENINNVNELHPFEPFAIKSNQLDDWKELIVKTKKKINSDDTTSSVSLDEESKAPVSDKLGTYLYITVCPQQNKGLSELFKDAQWYTEDTIIIEKNYEIFPSGIMHTRGSIMPTRRNIIHAADDFNYFSNPSLPLRTPAFHPYVATGIPLPASDTTLISCARRVYAPIACTACTASPARIPQPIASPVIDDLLFLNELSINNEKSATISKAISTVNKNIMSSKIAEMTGGQRIICQMGGVTCAEYDYAVRTEPKKIGLSIMDLGITKVYSKFTPDEIKEMIGSYLEEIKKSKDKEFISFAKNCKKYKSDVCTVCLGDVPNIVLVRCGHVCTCSDDCTDILKDKCPICRASIICKIKESVFNSNC